MLLMKKLNSKVFLVTNAVIAALFVNVIVFGPSLRMGEAFTAGLATGIGIGWAIFAIAGWRALKAPGKYWDERTQAIASRAAGIAFCIMLVIAAVASALLRSRTLAIEISAERFAILLYNLGISAWFLGFLIISGRM